jgi:RimJ/RimL family protein N-acetyltransferase
MSKKEGINWYIRKATEEDIPIILQLCYKLSVYEKLKFHGTPELYKKYGFSDHKIFNCLLVERIGEVGPRYYGMAIYYFTFSTFESKPTLWLEDLFILEKYRGIGIGAALFKKLCQIAVERDCNRVEWKVLNWNEPSKKFFLSIGAKTEDEWTTFRLSRRVLTKLAKR